MSRRIGKSKRLPSGIVKADREALVALKQMSGYAPSSPDLSVEAVSLLERALSEKEAQEYLTKKELKADRDGRADAEWNLHDIIMRIKASVLGQYGPNSDALASLGLKKQADYRSPRRPLPTQPSSEGTSPKANEHSDPM